MPTNPMLERFDVSQVEGSAEEDASPPASAHPWARPAHKPSAVLRKFLRLRADLQEHRAEVDQGVQLIRKGEAAGADDTARQDAAKLKAVLKDIAAELEMVTQKHKKYKGSTYSGHKGDPMFISFDELKRRQRIKLANYSETGTEIFNQTGDIFFLTVLWSKARTLFVFSAMVLAINMLGRMYIIRRDLKSVDEKQKQKFWRGAALFMLEPNIGSASVNDIIAPCLWNRRTDRSRVCSLWRLQCAGWKGL
jgi:hypothetical protein